MRHPGNNAGFSAKNVRSVRGSTPEKSAENYRHHTVFCLILLNNIRNFPDETRSETFTSNNDNFLKKTT
jgi:hypothetical protein